MHKATVVLRGMTCVFNIKNPIHSFINVVKGNSTCYPHATSTMKMVQKFWIDINKIRFCFPKENLHEYWRKLLLLAFQLCVMLEAPYFHFGLQSSLHQNKKASIEITRKNPMSYFRLLYIWLPGRSHCLLQCMPTFPAISISGVMSDITKFIEGLVPNAQCLNSGSICSLVVALFLFKFDWQSGLQTGSLPGLHLNLVFI